MKWLPCDSFTIFTELQPDEVIQRIARVTGKASFLRTGTGDFIFTGKVTADSFQIAVRLSYRNSFQPVLHGCVRERGEGAVVSVRQQMSTVTAAFVFIWFGGMLPLAVILLLLALPGKGMIGFFVCCIMSIAAYGLMNGGFWYEAKKSKKLLEELLSYQVS